MPHLSTFLQGVRVIDLSRHLPGPLGTLFMVDMGAEVIKIEPPAQDEIRHLGPSTSAGRPVFFDTVNAGKTVWQMDMRDPQERDAFLATVREADVVVESFRPGVLERLGIGYDTLNAINPGIILCSLNGYGRTGPEAQRASHDANFLAMAGVLDRNGHDGRTTFFEPPVADCSASLTAVIAILGALRARDRTGIGCQIDVALADAVMPLQMLQIAEMDATGQVPHAETGIFTGAAAFYNSYGTADGRQVTLGAVEPKFWQAFCLAAGRQDWQDRHGEPLPQHDLRAELSDYFAALTLDQAIDRFVAEDCCFAPVLDLAEALDTPHHRERGLIKPGADGLRQALFPVHVGGVPPAIRDPVREVTAAPSWRHGRETTVALTNPTTLPHLFDLTGQIVVVTGGSRGLGLQLAEAVGEMGGLPVLVSRSAEDLQAAVDHLAARDIRADWIATDLADEAAAMTLVDEVLARHARIDGLINNAGATWGEATETHPLAAWKKVMALNVTGPFLLSQAVGQRVFIAQGRGRILNIASVEGFGGHHPSMTPTIAYNTSKGAIINFTRALAAEWGAHGITVNALAPGYFPSKLTAVTLDRHADHLIANTPLGRLGGAHDLKGAAALLLSEAGRHITGQILVVDGGASII